MGIEREIKEMKEIKVGNYQFSEWTNKVLERAEKMLREETPDYELSDIDALRIIDYIVGFVSGDEDSLEQALEFLRN